MKEELNILRKEKERLKELQDRIEIEERIIECFEKNFERLRLDSGHSITPEIKRQALLQVIMYYRKLKGIAETVTDTEVKLTLPQQISPNGNKFTVEGIVDIIRDDKKNTTTMYDIKTHEADFVQANKNQYEKQLNVYTHIWQELRQQQLDSTAVVATQFPKKLKKALDDGDDVKIERELQEWNPVIEIPFSQSTVDETINQFACVVDKIEDGEFQPPSVAILNQVIIGTRQKFATRICRNCDARFSCNSYRDYASETSSFVNGFTEYISDLGANEDVENWTNTNAFEAPPAPNVEDEL
jgi:hypothetical protein